MGNLQKSKKHHYVPQCYLKNFTQMSQLYVLDIRKVQKGYKELPIAKHTGMICYFNDYYTIEPNDGNDQFRLNDYDSLFIESKVLSQLENRYGKIFEKLSKGISLSSLEAINLIDFIIQLKLRNPYWMKETLEKRKESFIDAAMDNLQAEKYINNPRFQHIPTQLKQAVADWVRRENKANPKFSKQMQLYSLIERDRDSENRNEGFRLALIDCNWVIYEAPKNGPYFITSDNPGYSLKENDEKIYNTNFSDHFMFFFPLSFNYCLVISSHEKDYAYSKQSPSKQYSSYVVSTDQVIAINNRSLQLINNLLIAVDKSYLSQVAYVNKPDKAIKVDIQ